MASFCLDEKIEIHSIEANFFSKSEYKLFEISFCSNEETNV